MKTQFLPKLKIFSIGLIEFDLSLDLDDYDIDVFKVKLENLNSINDCRNFLHDYNIEKKYDFYSKGLNFILILMNKLLNNKIENVVLAINHLTFNDENPQFLTRIILSHYKTKNISIIESNLVFPSMTNFLLNLNGTKIRHFFLKNQDNNNLSSETITHKNNIKDFINELEKKTVNENNKVFSSLEIDQSKRNESVFLQKTKITIVNKQKLRVKIPKLCANR